MALVAVRPVRFELALQCKCIAVQATASQCSEVPLPAPGVPGNAYVIVKCSVCVCAPSRPLRPPPHAPGPLLPALRTRPSPGPRPPSAAGCLLSTAQLD